MRFEERSIVLFNNVIGFFLDVYNHDKTETPEDFRKNVFDTVQTDNRGLPVLFLVSDRSDAERVFIFCKEAYNMKADDEATHRLFHETVFEPYNV